MNTTDLILLEDICPILHIGMPTAYKLATSGEINAFKLGGKWQLRLSDVDEYIERISQSTTQKKKKKSSRQK